VHNVRGKVGRGAVVSALGGLVLSIGSVVMVAAIPAAAQPYGPTGAGNGSATTTVPVPPAAGGSGLAFTGFDAELTTAVGAAAVGVGGLAVLAARRRRAAHR
jgi:hypothetical protein